MKFTMIMNGTTYQHHIIIRLCFFLLIVVFIITKGFNAHAAIRVEGTATYEVFSASSNQLVKVDEAFEAIVDHEHWLIKTRLLKITPPSNSDQLFCPPEQVAGSDGQDCYYLKTMPVGVTNKLVGWVEPSPVPAYYQSPAVSFLWIAYCSGSYLSGQSNSLRPVWQESKNRNRQGKCDMAIQFERSSANPQFLERLSYLCDGRDNPCEPKGETSNIMPPPWNNGFTQAVFQVQKFVDSSTVKTIPQVFRFDLYAASGPQNGDKTRLRIVHSTTATVTNIVDDARISSWLPEIPKGLKIGVFDYRFTDVVTNGDAIDYTTTGAWKSKADKEVQWAVRFQSPPK